MSCDILRGQAAAPTNVGKRIDLARMLRIGKAGTLLTLPSLFANIDAN